MKCPHCLTAFHDNWSHHHLGSDKDRSWHVQWLLCPECKRLVIRIGSGVRNATDVGSISDRFIAFPKATNRPPLSSDVPDKYAKDYREAVTVLADSAKASAALSRRTLQLLLRDEAKVKPGNLSNEIDETIASGKLPSDLGDALHTVRVLGNFATHPMKDTNTGAIVDVELGEAEWLLDALEGLFDFYFVRPAELKRRKDAINEKLQAAGKQPLP